MRILLDSDFYAVNWVRDRKITSLAAIHPAFPAEAPMELLNKHIQEHPLYAQICKYEPDLLDVGQWSEFTTVRSFKQTALYHDFFRLAGVKYQLAMTYCAPTGATFAPVFLRRDHDYRQTERDLLCLFGPHLRGAFLQMVATEELRDEATLQKITLNGGAAIVVDEYEKVQFATDAAWRLVHDTFPETPEESLPIQILEWLRRNSEKGDTLEIDRPEGRLICEYGPAVPWNGPWAKRLNGGHETGVKVRLLRFKEEKRAAELTALMRLGLTPREAEVLHWMMQGKRNDEIAIILAISPATVKKHCEHLYSKLGVGGRSGAMTMAWDLIKTI